MENLRKTKPTKGNVPKHVVHANVHIFNILKMKNFNFHSYMQILYSLIRTKTKEKNCFIHTKTV